MSHPPQSRFPAHLVSRARASVESASEFTQTILRRYRADSSQNEDDPSGDTTDVVGEWKIPFRNDRWHGGPIPRDTGAAPADPVRKAILHDVTSYFETASDDLGIGTVPSPAFVEGRLFDFSYLEAVDVIEWRWVDEPYAYVAVVVDRKTGRTRYLLQEPVLDEFEQYVWQDLKQTVRNQLLYRELLLEDDRDRLFTSELRTLIENHAVAFAADGSLYKLYYYLKRDFVNLGPIEPIMRDPDIEDISCDGEGTPIYVYHRTHRDLMTNVEIPTEEELKRFVMGLANRSNEQISVSGPLVDGSLPDGSRIQLTFGGDISTRGANFTIRKFASVPYTPVDLIRWGTFSVEQMAYFWLALESNKSLIFAGGTGSGKTTSLNAISFFIPEDSKVVSIEDTREISLPHDNWIQQLTRNGASGGNQGEVSMYDLLKSALRQRPEYLLVGEIRTDPRVAFTFFQAIGTGHTACTTLHADSVQGALNRLENQPLNIPDQMLLDLDIVSIQTQTFQDGERVRRNQQITEITSRDRDGELTGIDVFTRDPATDRIEQRANSRVLADIADERGWSRSDLLRDLADREAVLGYLLDEKIHGYHEVAAVIREFASDHESLLARVEGDEPAPVDRFVEERLDRGDDGAVDEPQPEGDRPA